MLYLAADASGKFNAISSGGCFFHLVLFVLAVYLNYLDLIDRLVHSEMRYLCLIQR